MDHNIENDDLPIRDLVLVSAGPNIGKVVMVLRTHLDFTLAQAHETIRSGNTVIARDSRLGLESIMAVLRNAGATVELL